MSEQLQMLQCPYCKKEFPLTEAIAKQIEDRIRLQVNVEAERREQELALKAEDLVRKQKELEQQSKTLEQQIAEQVSAQLKSEREKIAKEAAEKAKEDLDIELEAAKSEAAEKQNRLEEAKKRELDLLKDKRELEEKQQMLELEMARKLNEERKLIANKAVENFQEEQRLKDRQTEEMIAGLKRTIDDLKRKADQGSQQIQGEALEVELETILKNRFPSDEIIPVSKGQRGADIMQKVYDSAAHENCGIILWETKQAKNWSDSWIEKLKKDQREAKADLSVILSMDLPNGITNFGQVEGIWVTNFGSAYGLAMIFRHTLIQLYQTKNAAVSKDERIEYLYRYLSGPQFRQKVEAIIDAFTQMSEELNKERRTMITWWSKREQEIQRVIESTSGLYGDLQGIIGASLPSIERLQLPVPDEIIEKRQANEGSGRKLR